MAIFKKIVVVETHYSASLLQHPTPKNYISKISNDKIRIIGPWLKNPDMFEFVEWKNQIFVVLKTNWDDFIFLSGKINIRSPGICIGKIVNGELIPSHDLAQSTIISEIIQSVDLMEGDAIRYLRRDEIKLVNSELKGWTVVKFEGQNLGWIKILDHRINNYYPKEYRILKT